jgi:5-methylcytosine-specific restriction endonuclease McrA
VSRSGRSGTGNARYRRNRDLLLGQTTVCGLCGHEGAKTADHIVPDPLWPRDGYGRRLPGFDELANLQPAHGTMGAGRDVRQNPCPTCGQMCNQSKGARVAKRPQTRDWGI